VRVLAVEGSLEGAIGMHMRLKRGSEEGFSLVELMMVVLIIGILIAVALPTFLGSRERSADRAAQSDLRSGFVAALTYYTDGGTFSGFDVPTAQAMETGIAWIGGGAPAVGEISIHVASGPQLLLVGRSVTGTYFCLAQMAGSPNQDLGQAQAFADVDTVAECNQGW